MRNDRHYSPLVYACYTNQLDCFKVIFEHGLEYTSVSELVTQWLGPEKAQTECLNFAIEHSNGKLLSYLLDTVKLNPNLAAVKDNHGKTSLHQAAAKGDCVAITLL